MTAVILSIAARQSADVRRRAAAVIEAQRARTSCRSDLVAVMDQGPVLPLGTVAYASLDAWYRARPTPSGRIRPRLVLSPAEKRIYGLPASARLIDLRGLGAEANHWLVAVFPVMGGHVVGVKAPGGGGVGVVWRKSYKASAYAMRLSVEHGLPIVERYA